MATYPVEFHRRLEQKWESRIDQFSRSRVQCPPPRRPNDDDDDGDADGFKIHRGVLGLEEAEGTYNDRHFIEAAAFPM